MAVGFSNTNKPFNPRGNDQSPLAFNRAKLFSGKALDFDGVNDYVDLSGLTLNGSKQSFAFYLKSDSWGNYDYIFDINPSRFIIGSGNIAGILGVYDGAAWKSFGEIDDTTNTNHFVVTIDGTTSKAYLNGVQFGSTLTIASRDFSSATEAALMTQYDGNSGVGANYNGQLSGFKIFNTALTAAQVADLYNNPEKVVPTGVDNTALKLWLPMQEGAGTTAYDGSGNGNHGTISGATYVHGIGAPVSQTAVIDWNKGSNLFAHSQALSNWTQLNTTTTDDSAISPDGTQNAAKLVASSGNSNKVIYKAITANTYTASIFAKKGEFEGLVIATGNVGAFFNLDTQAFRADYSAPVTSYNIEDFGNGWHRYSITFTEAGANNLYIGPNDNISATLAITGDGVKGIYIWGASLEQSTTAGPYIPTLATAQTSPVLLPQGLTSGRDITGVNLFENVRKQGALNLDGNSWAEVHDNASLDVTTAVTLEAWVYWDGSVTSAKGLLGRWFAGGACYMFFTNNATQVSFYINTSSSTFTISGTGWKHIVGTYDSIKRRVYVDGQEIGSGTAYTTAIATSSDPVEIGRYNGNTGYQYDGDIAQPRIYNRALTAEEVQRNYNAGKNTYTN